MVIRTVVRGTFTEDVQIVSIQSLAISVARDLDINSELVINKDHVGHSDFLCYVVSSHALLLALVGRKVTGLVAPALVRRLGRVREEVGASTIDRVGHIVAEASLGVCQVTVVARSREATVEAASSD